MNTYPKYYLTDVPHNLRRSVLDLCFKRLWHDALELLQQHRFLQYTIDDLMNFYSWAPTTLPEAEAPPAVPPPDPAPATTDNAPPAPSLSGSMDSSMDGSMDCASDERLTSDNPEPETAAPEPPPIHPIIQQSIDPVSPPTSDLRSPTSDLLTNLRDLISRYVVLPELAAETLALWVVHTYAFTLRQVTTYIGVVSPEKRCGKTTLLELLGLLANRSLTAANISPPALFRVIQETQPTLIIDEADTFLQGRDEMAGILNAGYRKGNAYVVRVAEGKARKKQGESGARASSRASIGEWTPEPAPSDPTNHPSTDPLILSSADPTTGATELARYSCWCPKVMAAIGRLPDTLADRCILITMQRKTPGEQCERLRHLDATEFRQRCADFVREHGDAIAAARPEIPSSLNDRAADIWEPLLAIADLAGGDWPHLAREAAQKLSAYDDEITLIGYFLKDLRALMLLKKVDRILSRDIVTILNPMHHRPWEDLRRGREINEWWLGHKMSELGIRARSLRYGESVGRGYLLEDVEAAFQRYVRTPELQNAQGSANEERGTESPPSV